MSYFNMVCDSCGREVYGCNIVNGMKFCAKCYQETFGETDKDKQIAELQKQLKSQPAEIVEKIKEQIFNHFNVKNIEEYDKNIEEYERLSLPNALFTADAVAEILDTILKEYQK